MAWYFLLNNDWRELFIVSPYGLIYTRYIAKYIKNFYSKKQSDFCIFLNLIK